VNEVAIDHTAVAAAASALREQAGALQEATDRVRYAGAAPAGAAEQVVDGTGEAFGRHGARLAEALATLADALDAQRDAVARTDRRYVL
jgi:uncharacterized protein YukE